MIVPRFLFEPVTIAILCDLLLAGFGFQSNRRRLPNIGFSLMAISIALWMITRQIAFTSIYDVRSANLWIRVCSILGALVPVAGALMRSAVTYQNQGWRVVLKQLRPWWYVFGAVSVLCITPFYYSEIRLPEIHDGVIKVTDIPKPIMQSGALVYLAYLLGSGVMLVYLVWRDQRNKRVTGALATELQYMQLGYIVLLVGAVITIGPKARFNGPFSVLAYVTVIAYGITTRSILDVRTVLRRFLSQAVLFAYACTVFGVTWWAMQWVFTRAGAAPVAVETWPALLAAFAVALLVTPSRAGFQRLARGASRRRGTWISNAASRVWTTVIQSVVSRRELLDGFCRVCCGRRPTPAPSASPSRDAAGGFKQFYPPAVVGWRFQLIALPENHPLTAAFQARPEAARGDRLGAPGA